MERRYAFEAKGYDFDQVIQRVAQVLNINVSVDNAYKVKYLTPNLSASFAIDFSFFAPQTVKARSLLCFWANRELGMTTVAISHRLKLSQSAVSRASMRGEKIALQNDFQL